jgi:hypothetical protein
MENEMYQDEFEQFLRNEVKQHRMYPSDHIWKNVRTELHGYRSWPALTFISLFIITALTISTMIGNQPPHEQPASRNKAVPVTEEQVITQATPIASSVREDNTYFGKMAPGSITAQTFTGNLPVRSYTVASTIPVSAAPVSPENTATITKTAYSSLQPQQPLLSHNLMLVPDLENGIPEAARTVANTTVSTETKKMSMHQPTDMQLDQQVIVKAKERPGRNSRFGFQFYVTPSTSYRRLSDEKVKEVIQPAVSPVAATNIPLTGSTADVNSVVRHRPAVGLELGFAALYNISNRLKLKTGVQLNVRQYYIETFQSRTNDLTMVSLINNRGVETINFYSPYNNNTGYKAAQLQNRVYQISIPVGIQWDVLSGRNLGINTEASVQPTMMLNNTSYVLSTDYKHYTNGGQFMRKWNINTSVGINLTYRAGTSSWQIGPQVRYQHLSTYSNAYPIKEHLMDYGIRLGFTKQIN